MPNESSFQLIVISKEDFFKEEVAFLKQILEKTRLRFHLRKPNASLEDMQFFLSEFSEVERSAISLHSHYELGARMKVGGLHLQDGIEADNEALYKKFARQHEMFLSKSCHALKDALNLDGFSYSFLSPIFDSLSKRNYRSAFHVSELKNINSNCKVPLIALGGIQPENVNKAKSYGFAGAATLGYIWQSRNPLASCEALYKKVVGL